MHEQPIRLFPVSKVITQIGAPILMKPDIFVPLGLLTFIVLLCLVGPLVLPIPNPIGGNVIDANLPPFFPGHLLGTDQNGNDVWSRLIYGGRASLLIALTVNFVGIAGGGSLGVISAHFGGRIDSLLMRMLDVLIAFPPLVLTLAVAESLGPSKTSTTIALTLFSIPAFARVSRAATLRLRERPFMLAAMLTGTRTWRILLYHISPNILPQLLAFGCLGMGISVVIEGGLSFLGLGIQPPESSWGNMIALGQQMLAIRPFLLAVPSAALFLTVLSLNLLGEALRERGNSR